MKRRASALRLGDEVMVMINNDTNDDNDHDGLMIKTRARATLLESFSFLNFKK